CHFVQLRVCSQLLRLGHANKTLIFTTLLLLIPSNFSGWLKFVTLALGWYIWINVMTNWILCAFTSNSYKASKNLTGSHESSTKHCAVCQHDIPPRAHHCQVCQQCVLKRDHHCVFIGNCVGYYNHKSFLVLLFWVAWGNVYITLNLLIYFASINGILFSWNHILPVAFVRYWYGSVPGDQLLLILMLYLSVCKLLSCYFMYAWQFTITCEGQVTYEALNNISVYDCGLTNNLKTVFGDNWVLRFIIPLPCQMPGNGRDWKMGKNKTQKMV
uniref:Palmitoyltransferase n=1 Tax=Erpetoichthys calabaricus TaxID=27687 RepID=A0A8C4TE79_ERPCA